MTLQVKKLFELFLIIKTFKKKTVDYGEVTCHLQCLIFSKEKIQII